MIFFLRLTKVVQDAYLDDLKLIKDLKKSSQNFLSAYDYHPLILLGLIYQETEEQSDIEVEKVISPGGYYNDDYYEEKQKVILQLAEKLTHTTHLLC